LSTIQDLKIPPKKLGIYNDRFGFLTCYNHHLAPIIICTSSSQNKAIEENLKTNNLSLLETENPLSHLPNKMDHVLLKIPKSLSEFRLYLDHIVHNSTEELTVTCAFMTRHFSPKMLTISKEYFEEVEQSKAVKKARLMTLRKKKTSPEIKPIKSIEYKSSIYKQYWGVFSGEHIDYATQYFLEQINLDGPYKSILDVGSGNGIIANEIYKRNPDAEIHLLDDSYLAIASSKLNILGKNVHHHCDNNLSIFKDQQFDLIVSNPPFHFEHEINIQIAIKLFKECQRCLKEGGIFQLVANKHLNYKTHLQRIFSTVEIVSENEKFIVYKCLH